MPSATQRHVKRTDDEVISGEVVGMVAKNASWFCRICQSVSEGVGTASGIYSSQAGSPRGQISGVPVAAVHMANDSASQIIIRAARHVLAT